MKKLGILLFVFAASFQTFAQETALLRINYNEGDVYEVKLVQKQSTGAVGGTDMTMLMDMTVTGVEGETFTTASKITSIAMDMNQAGMTMSYNSATDPEELDATGQMLKAQLDPMMEAVISNTIDIYGNTLDTTVEPAVAGMEQFNTGQNSLSFPKEEVSAGSSWTTENEVQGMTVKTTYTVNKIENGLVYVDITGDVSGMGTGKMTGSSIIDSASGLSKNTTTELTIEAQGMQVTVASEIEMSKK